MKFQTGKDLIEKAMARIDTIVPARETTTLLSNVFITIEKDSVSITASDMESTVRIAVPAENTEQGEIIVRAKKFSEIARQLRSDQIVFKTVEPENAESVESDETLYDVLIEGSGKSSARYKMSGKDRSLFPAINQVSEDRLSNVPSAVLDEMVKKTIYSITQEDNRYIYNGLAFQADGNKLTIVGTDGRRLAAISRTLENPVTLSPDAAADTVVHSKAIRELQKLIDSAPVVKLGVEQRDIFFKIGDAELVSRLVEGKFPDYRRVIPESLSIEFTLNREDLLNALSQVKVMTEPPSFQVRLTLEGGELHLVANTPQVGTAEMTLPIGYTGEKLQIGFNATYMIDILRSLSCETVKLGFNDSARPIVVFDTDDADFLALVMPMKI